MLSYQFQKGKYFADQASQIGNDRSTSEKQKSLRTYLKLYDNLWLQLKTSDLLFVPRAMYTQFQLELTVFSLFFN